MGQWQSKLSSVLSERSAKPTLAASPPSPGKAKPARMKTKPKGGKGSGSSDGGGASRSGKKGGKKGGSPGSPTVDLAPYEHVRHCPRYSALLEAEPEEEALGLEDLDPLQGELEMLLIVGGERQRHLARQLHKLTAGEHSWAAALKTEEDAVRDGSAAEPLPMTSAANFLLPPLPKLTPANSAHRLSKTQAMDKIAAEAGGSELESLTPGYQPVPITDRRGRKRVYFWPQNHMPDKFWGFVEAYSRPPTEADLKTLKDLIRDNTEERNRKFFTINTDFYKNPRAAATNGTPPSRSLRPSSICDPAVDDDVGRLRKGTKRKLDASPEIGGSGEGSDGERRLNGSALNGSAPKAGERKSRRLSTAGGGSNGAVSDPLSLGPLTERLVQALVEDNEELLPPASALDDLGALHSAALLNGSPNKLLVKSLNLGNLAALERRLKKELEEQGLLSPNGEEEEEEERETKTEEGEEVDEVSRELEQRERELRGMMETNRLRLSALLGDMQRARERSALTEELEAANEKIVGLYGRFYSTIPKRKPANKKEREQLWEAIRAREALLAQFDEA